jgi:hypothetical protein
MIAHLMKINVIFLNLGQLLTKHIFVTMTIQQQIHKVKHALATTTQPRNAQKGYFLGADL